MHRNDPMTSSLARAWVLRPFRAGGYIDTQPRAAHYGFADSASPGLVYCAPSWQNMRVSPTRVAPRTCRPKANLIVAWGKHRQNAPATGLAIVGRASSTFSFGQEGDERGHHDGANEERVEQDAQSQGKPQLDDPSDRSCVGDDVGEPGGCSAKRLGPG